MELYLEYSMHLPLLLRFYVDDIWVNTDHRGKGFGKKLWKRIRQKTMVLCTPHSGCLLAIGGQS